MQSFLPAYRKPHLAFAQELNAEEKKLLDLQSVLYQASLLQPYTRNQAVALAKTVHGQRYVVNTQTGLPAVKPQLYAEMKALSRTNKSKL